MHWTAQMTVKLLYRTYRVKQNRQFSKLFMIKPPDVGRDLQGVGNGLKT